MAKLKAVCFDLDLTLLNYSEADYLRTIDCVCGDLARAHHQVDAATLAPRFWEINVRRWAVEGSAGSADLAPDGHAYWRETWAMALASLGCHEAAVADDALALYVRYRHEHYRLYEDVMSTLEVLKTTHRLAVITNGPGTTQRDKLRFLQVEPWFDVCVVSGEVGFKKPDVAIFEHTLRALGASPDEALHVGDSLASDVGGALRAGMTAVWLNRSSGARAEGEPSPHHEIASLTELLGLL